tara:strand:- start:17032 stop:17289 length:258 start_codon:yes stop_codon:yes gene_type:complete
MNTMKIQTYNYIDLNNKSKQNALKDLIINYNSDWIDYPCSQINDYCKDSNIIFDIKGNIIKEHLKLNSNDQDLIPLECRDNWEEV